MKLDFIDRCTIKTENPPAGSSRNSKTVTAADGSGISGLSATGLRLLLGDALKFSTSGPSNLAVGIALGEISQRSLRAGRPNSSQRRGGIESNFKLRRIGLPLQHGHYPLMTCMPEALKRAALHHKRKTRFGEYVNQGAHRRSPCKLTERGERRGPEAMRRGIFARRDGPGVEPAHAERT